MVSAPPAVDPAPEVRERIAAAARELFADRGYDSTTVDAIAERAGIARRTFFRYFRSKDDAIFPDHERIAQQVVRYFEAAADVPPVSAVCGGARLVLTSYVDDPVVSVERYRLARAVPALRAREIASVSQYARLFSRYLHERYGDAPDAELRADVVAGAVVGAHNQVLRGWLRAGGEGDPLPAMDAAFTWVVDRFEDPAVSGTTRAAANGTTPGDDVVVAVFRAGQPLDDVVERISRSL